MEPLLPDRTGPDRTPRRGGRWRDHREVIDAIAWKFRTGSQWVHLPEKHGNWRGVHHRLRMWAVDGTRECVLTALMSQADADEELNRVVSVDSTIVRAHQHSAGARTKRPSRYGCRGAGEALLYRLSSVDIVRRLQGRARTRPCMCRPASGTPPRPNRVAAHTTATCTCLHRAGR
ncbi:transposase [Streptomyces sp. NPDC048638]|uniref:transposase n=1 Tax=Streptomyces sp. NPDC048638 TaxID=3365580 RepID=UPI0037230358